MSDELSAFYDRLASDYHRIYSDWNASIDRQAEVLDRIVEAELGPGPKAILDATCGIGTQAIGLAARGHRVHATDLSPDAVRRAEREATAAGVSLTTGVADLRELAATVPGTFDVVLACDNALAHLPTRDDLALAVAQMAAKLRSGGLFLASIRDYDRLREERPQSEGPRVVDDAEGRRIVLQIWDWADDGERLQVSLFFIRQQGDDWRTEVHVTDLRALRRRELDAALAGAGLDDVRWLWPADTGYHQPVVIARAPGVL
jgi:SAM-dependent methyltransferase